MSELPRVLSYPPVHDYVDRLHGTAATLVHRDEPWPLLPHLYDPDWIRARATDWDVAHFHFTWEQYPPQTFGEVLAAHRAAGTPVVWTAHDLRNPHVPDASSDDPYLRALAATASQVLTLTPGAAAEVTGRFGVSPQIVPHGPLLAPADAAPLRRPPVRSGPLRALLLAKSLRANLDWRTPLETVAGMDTDPPVELDVHLHPDAPDRGAVQAFDGQGRVRVTVGDRLSAPELWRRIADADVLLLPYRWGTHSGLLELATDLGTPVVVTDVGYLSQQAPCHVVRTRDGDVDPDRLRTVLTELASGQRAHDVVPASLRERVLAEFHRAHAALYARLASSRGTAVAR
ncbi:MAG: hypothetical protein KY461_02710 [Actinobacteria bacterium]|nr:hypothetical protein [Actinomycetota bacterium]